MKNANILFLTLSIKYNLFQYYIVPNINFVSSNKVFIYGNIK